MATAGNQTHSPEPAPVTLGKHTPASKLRRILAQRMLAGVTQAAPVTLTTKVDAAPVVAYRANLKNLAPKGQAPSFNDILIRLAAQTLRALPELNVCWHRDGIHAYEAIHIATAVDTPAGLLAPVIRHADQLSVAQIAEQTRQLIAQARAGRLNQTHLEGGTFTVTNLGMFGIDTFTPILNLPQAGILGIGRIVEEPVVRAGRLEIGHTLSLSLTFDHRVVDGAPPPAGCSVFANAYKHPRTNLALDQMIGFIDTSTMRVTHSENIEPTESRYEEGWFGRTGFRNRPRTGERVRIAAKQVR